MITCTLGEKRYSVDFISGRALREMGPAWDMYARLSAVAADAVTGKVARQAKDGGDQPTVTAALDVLVKWFCLVFGNQFSPDDVYDHYPVDRLMHDVVLALLAVQTQTTEVLNEFPTPAAQGETAS
jgi:hypothetical protein